MRAAFLSIALSTALIAAPVHASDQSLDESVDQINELFSDGFSGDGTDLAVRDMFLKAASLAENVLATHENLDAVTKRDMHYQAANGYYYASEKEHWLATGADDPTALTAAKIDNLVKALAHQKIAFADGQDGLLVAEYLFGTNMLVEHGLKTDDPRTAEWSAANVHAGRLRIDESKMLQMDSDYDAMCDLALALLDFVKITGDEAAKAEVAELIATIPEDERNYALRGRLR